jgi:hypothetical protein
VAYVVFPLDSGGCIQPSRFTGEEPLLTEGKRAVEGLTPNGRLARKAGRATCCITALIIFS